MRLPEAGCWLHSRCAICLYVAYLYPRPSVRVEEPRPTRDDPVCAERNGSKGVNLEKSPIPMCGRRVYGLNGSGRVCRERGALGYQTTFQM